MNRVMGSGRLPARGRRPPGTRPAASRQPFRRDYSAIWGRVKSYQFSWPLTKPFTSGASRIGLW